jgi:hypothetical protein
MQNFPSMPQNTYPQNFNLTQESTPPQNYPPAQNYPTPPAQYPPPPPMNPQNNYSSFRSAAASAAVSGQSMDPSATKYNEKYEPQTWKLFKPKYVLIYYLCEQCHDRLYQSKDKLATDPIDGGARIQIDMCGACVDKNIRGTTALTKPYVPKKANM